MDLQSIREVALSTKEQLLTGAGAWGPVILGLVFMGSAMIGMPIFYITVLAGMVYGVGPGYGLIMASVLCAVVIIHWLVRWAFRRKLEERLSRDRRLKVLDKALSEEGAKIVFLLRMVPLLPLGIGSYLFSLTGIRTVPYFVATILGVAPGTFLYVWLGSVLLSTVEGLGVQAQTYMVWTKWLGLAAFGIAYAYLSVVVKRALGRLMVEDFEREESKGAELAP